MKAAVPVRLPRISASAAVALAVMSVVMVLASAIVAAALYWVQNEPVADALARSGTPGGTPQTQDSGSVNVGDVPACGEEPGKGQADVSLTGRAVGPLRTEITAQVTINGNALTDANPLVSADMAEMPCAHQIPYAALLPLAGSPGTYRAEVPVVMVGTWKFTVRLGGSVSGAESITTNVSTVSTQ
ncbi:MAG: FixH family protein [Chloroflexi bacterium]|nr:FixH family protein [Chloroflexota bacterium]